MTQVLTADGDGRHRSWHALQLEEVLAELQSREAGLRGEEARERLEQYGPNSLPAEERAGPLRRFFRQFNNTLIYVLLAAAAFTAVLREWLDTAVILAVAVINAVIGFLQEGKAERALEAVRGMLSQKATVLRDGEPLELPAEELVPGDVVLLKAGDRVPADLRILQARQAQIDEATLTGESEPVEKQVEPVEADALLGDRRSMAYSATMVTAGRLRGVVVATGREAEIGRISALVSAVTTTATPLLRKVDAFGRVLAAAILLLAAAVFVLAYGVRDLPARDTFMAVVGLAVAAIPEGLPVIMTIILALGVQRMARRAAIVRQLPAVETLGSVTVICTDKTGTLTRNEMTVTRLVAAGRTYEVSGAGYRPEGRLSLADQPVSVDEHPWVVELARAGLLASDARLRKQEGGDWSIEGSPTEASLVVLALKVGLDREQELAARPSIGQVPFESERRFMATLHSRPGGDPLLCVKGAPEKLLEMCSTQRGEEGVVPLDASHWRDRETELASTGHRVLALATRPAVGAATVEEAPLEGLTMLGLVGIMDPPREEASAAIAECRQAGIRVKMITGDHALTARSIAASMGIGDGAQAVTGVDLERASGEELVQMAGQADVFARASPEHKLRIVEALQSRGEIVAMTGDGVNDAPALKRADVGVAMGIRGSEASKEAADIVLADDNFASIERAVEEGRTIYDNLVKTIVFVLPTNGAEALAVLVSVLFFFEVMPITPIQILWVNMVTAVTLAIGLAFEPAEEGIMSRPPRPPGAPILSGVLIWRIGLVAVVIASAALFLFKHRFEAHGSLELARTVAVNTLAAGQVFYLFSSRFLARSSLGPQAFTGNPKLLVAVGTLALLQLGFTYLGVANKLFGTAPLPALEWLWILASGLPVFLAVELEKALLSGWRARTATSASRAG